MHSAGMAVRAHQSACAPAQQPERVRTSSSARVYLIWQRCNVYRVQYTSNNVFVPAVWCSKLHKVSESSDAKHDIRPSRARHMPLCPAQSIVLMYLNGC